MNPARDNFKPEGRVTLIGSLPAAGYEQALQLITQYTPDIPLWPQLPSNPLEGMMNQFVEGLPGVVEQANKTFFNINYDGFEAEQLQFYEDYLAVSEAPELALSSRFAVSRERAQGIYTLKEQYSRQPAAITAVKGQTTGPFTLLTGLTDQEKRLGYYEPLFRDLAVKALAMKAAWQVEFLKTLEVPVIIFIDEPALAGLGSSAFISIAQEDIAQDLSEVIDAIHKSGGLAGIHVCANTDWSFLLSLDLDILNFDAFGFFDRLITCKDQLHAFLDRGGIMAWGIVPTAEAAMIQAESCASLVARWESQATLLSGGKWDKTAILARSLITPSCGTGTLTPAVAERVLQLSSEVSTVLRQRYLP